MAMLRNTAICVMLGAFRSMALREYEMHWWSTASCLECDMDISDREAVSKSVLRGIKDEYL